MNFKRELTGLLLLIAVLPILLCGMALYIYRVDHEQVESLSNTVYQTVNAVQTQMHTVDTVLKILADDYTLRNYLSVAPENDSMNGQIDEMMNIRKQLVIMQDNEWFYAIRLFVPTHKFYTADRNEIFDIALAEEDEYLQKSDVRIRYSPVHRQTYLEKQSADVISAHRQIIHAKQVTRPVGLAVIDLDVRKLRETLTSLVQGKIRVCSLLSSDGKVLLSTDSDTVGMPSGYDIGKLLLNEQYAYSQGSTRVVMGAIPECGWYLAAELETGLLGLVDDDFIKTFLLLAALLVLFLIMVAFVVQGISKRMSAIVMSVDRVQPPTRPFGIFRSMDQTIDSVYTMIAQREEALKRQEEDRLKLLQAQINPHFIYNTLNNVYWMIQRGAKDESSELVLTLAKYFRMVLARGKDIITVGEEIEMTRLYARIQRSRTNLSFEFEAYMEDSIVNALIPKLSIQPFVENAIMHGLADKGEGQIFVDAMAEGENDIVITITDNGIGMTREQMDTVLNTASAGFGILNVKERLALFSDTGNYGVSVQSEKGKYTTFTLRIAKRMTQIDDNSGNTIKIASEK